jgi:hypothetical protein
MNGIRYTMFQNEDILMVLLERSAESKSNPGDSISNIAPNRKVERAILEHYKTMQAVGKILDVQETTVFCLQDLLHKAT